MAAAAAEEEPGPRDLWAAAPQRYDFASEARCEIGSWVGTERSGAAPRLCGPGTSSFFQLPGLLDPQEVEKILACTVRSEAYETDPDSVDNMPSFEYYPMLGGSWADLQLRAALDGAINDRILPYIRNRYDCPSCTLSSVLVRRYLPGERRTHAVHFDKQAFVTAVLGLSNPKDYEGGLYLQPGPSADSRLFPRIEPGDLLVHSFDLQHGVHLAEGVRYSLVLWLKDSPDAVRDDTTPWLDGPAEAGDPHALHLLAENFEFGEFGQRRDLRRAVQLYRRSAEAGHYWSQNSLACLYQEKAQQVNDVAEALACWKFSVKWLRAAAESGFAEAQRNLAAMYLEGAAAGYDAAQAVAWMRRAAEQLDVDAAHELGCMLRDGVGAPADLAEARQWLQRSARAGHAASGAALEELEERLLEESLAEGDDDLEDLEELLLEESLAEGGDHRDAFRPG